MSDAGRESLTAARIWRSLLPTDIPATNLRVGDDLFGAGVITRITRTKGALIVDVVGGRIFSLNPEDEVTVRRA